MRAPVRHDGQVTQMPAWATEPVVIVESDPNWPIEAKWLAEGLQQQLHAWLVSDVEHVGSTSIPGLAAKPIIDLQALVEYWDVLSQAEASLVVNDWFLVPADLDQRPWRRLLVRVRDGRRHAHLHLMRPGAARWDEQRQFRDALRSDPPLAARYAALKRDLAAADTDRERYSAAKADFVRSVITDATGRPERDCAL